MERCRQRFAPISRFIAAKASVSAATLSCTRRAQSCSNATTLRSSCDACSVRWAFCNFKSKIALRSPSPSSQLLVPYRSWRRSRVCVPGGACVRRNCCPAADFNVGGGWRRLWELKGSGPEGTGTCPSLNSSTTDIPTAAVHTIIGTPEGEPACPGKEASPDKACSVYRPCTSGMPRERSKARETRKAPGCVLDASWQSRRAPEAAVPKEPTTVPVPSGAPPDSSPLQRLPRSAPRVRVTWAACAGKKARSSCTRSLAVMPKRTSRVAQSRSASASPTDACGGGGGGRASAKQVSPPVASWSWMPCESLSVSKATASEQRKACASSADSAASASSQPDSMACRTLTPELFSKALGGASAASRAVTAEVPTIDAGGGAVASGGGAAVAASGGSTRTQVPPTWACMELFGSAGAVVRAGNPVKACGVLLDDRRSGGPTESPGSAP
mmetsp:Transcript_28857/g.95980  ORF Transcript_28857/g.95980 Transcript_28857/m.95980 type:complete len:443 (+) Transcript_28857:153-1481(+)